MFQYIGIRGHRGAGKNTIALLIGSAIEYLTTHHSFEGYEEEYANVVKNIQENPDYMDYAGHFERVYMESFTDTLKTIINSLTNISIEAMSDDWLKDNAIVDLSDFSLFIPKDKLQAESHKESLIAYGVFYTAESFFEKQVRVAQYQSPHIIEDAYMTLREFIIYFGKYVMQNFMGRDVWVKSLKVNEGDLEQFYASHKKVYKIFVDTKFPSEISYISYKGGKIIKVSRPDNEKEDTDISHELDNDTRYDYEIVNPTDLLTIREQIQDIASQIVNA